MKTLWPFAALGLGAYLLFALVTLPAAVLVPRVLPEDVSVSGLSGTAWKGRAHAVQLGGRHLGGLEWDLHGLRLLTGRLAADVKITRIDGFAQGTVSVAPGGRTAFETLSASLPMSALPPAVVPGGWAGTLNVRLAELVLDAGWPVEADGTLEALDLLGPAHRPVGLGSYKVTFPAETQGDGDDDLLRGSLSDLGGPLQMSGILALDPDRSWLIEGMIAARPEAPADVVNTLNYLGPPDPQGRRPFSLSGTF